MSEKDWKLKVFSEGLELDVLTKYEILIGEYKAVIQEIIMRDPSNPLIDLARSGANARLEKHIIFMEDLKNNYENNENEP